MCAREMRERAPSLKCMGGNGKRTDATDTVGSQINNSVVRPSNGKRGKSGKEGRGGRASPQFPQFSRDISGQSCRGNGPFRFLDKSQHLKNILSRNLALTKFSQEREEDKSSLSHFSDSWPIRGRVMRPSDSGQAGYALSR